MRDDEGFMELAVRLDSCVLVEGKSEQSSNIFDLQGIVHDEVEMDQDNNLEQQHLADHDYL